MKTLARKSQTTPLVRPYLATCGFSHPAGQPSMPTHREASAAGWTGTTSSPIRHDFSQLAIYPQAIGQPPLIQRSRAVSSPEDAHERAADTVADQVMRMTAPRPEIVSAGDGTYSVGKADWRPHQAITDVTTEMTPATGMALNAAAKGGAPLPAELRTYFEPRFGHDFSHVRLHIGGDAAEGASAVQAQAYTVGRDIVFGAGHYAPATMAGKHLLAHELAHVVQQDHAPALINRKLRCDPQASLSGFLAGKGISNVNESSNVYTRAKGGALHFEQEVLIDLLASPRIFNVDGDSDATAAANLDQHVKARTGIVSFAAQKRYAFNALSGWSMNPQYYDWNTNKGTWKMKPGVDKQAAWDDLNVNPQQYAIGCAAATDLTMKGGSKGANIIDKPSTDTTDWVAGDAGYIENASYQPATGQIGLMGENIIYTGNGQFWGHIPGNVTYRTLADWITEVQSWTQGGGTAKVDNKRELPATGLLEP